MKKVQTWDLIAKSLYPNSLLGFGEAAEHEGDHGQINEALAVVGALLVVPGQASPLHQPRQRALDHPAPRQHGKPLLSLGPPHDLQGQRAFRLGTAHVKAPQLYAAPNRAKAQNNEAARVRLGASPGTWQPPHSTERP